MCYVPQYRIPLFAETSRPFFITIESQSLLYLGDRVVNNSRHACVIVRRLHVRPARPRSSARPASPPPLSGLSLPTSPLESATEAKIGRTREAPTRGSSRVRFPPLVRKGSTPMADLSPRMRRNRSGRETPGTTSPFYVCRRPSQARADF